MVLFLIGGVAQAQQIQKSQSLQPQQKQQPLFKPQSATRVSNDTIYSDTTIYVYDTIHSNIIKITRVEEINVAEMRDTLYINIGLKRINQISDNIKKEAVIDYDNVRALNEHLKYVSQYISDLEKESETSFKKYKDLINQKRQRFDELSLKWQEIKKEKKM